MIEPLTLNHAKWKIKQYLVWHETRPLPMRSQLAINYHWNMASHGIVPNTERILTKYITVNGLVYQDIEDLYND